MPPSDGVEPLKEILRKNPTNAVLNVTTGDFRKAMELMRNQLGITNFAPLK